VKQYIRQRAKFGALTTLLPELADNEVTKCFQYLLMNKDTFQELLALVEPLIVTTRSQKVGSRLVGWVVSKFHQSSRSKTCFRPAVGSKAC